MERKISKRRNIFICGVAILVLAIASVIMILQDFDDNSDDALRFKWEYEELNSTIREGDGAYLKLVYIPADNPFRYLTVEEALEFSKTGTGVIFIGGAWCRLCRLTAPYIVEAISKLKEHSTVYYVPILMNDESSGEAGYREFAEHIGKYILRAGTAFANVTGNESRIEAYIGRIEERGFSLLSSTLLFYNNGMLIGAHLGAIPGHNDSDIPFTQQQAEQFIEIFNEHMSGLGGNPCPPGC
ncbi:MAG: hypothetical protein FWC20_03050 [Oscillospiraceae bacterium]|nr:hypothetical protein [Oscillospiraceae bacterium]MCL2278369.1 hypothetical protein [Oscillospiraceae bacterium]